MSKNKSSGIKYKSEEEAYNDLLRLIGVWTKNGTSRYHRASYLKSLKKEFRSARICELIFSNNLIFRLNEEIPYVPLDIMSENTLIKWIYNYPELICPVNQFGNKKDVYIPEEKQTLPVCVAFELGKRRYEKLSALQWGRTRWC